GDTLFALAARYRTSIQAIATTNHLADPNRIYSGEQLCVPTPQTIEVGGTTSAPNQSSNSPNQPSYAPKQPSSAKGSQAFVALALPYARQAHQSSGWPVSLILAQWGLEQGWKTPGYTGYNFGNVAALPGEPTVKGIQKVGSPRAFAYAKSP